MGVVVVGVGRSGTSVATAALAALMPNAELPGDDFPAGPDNPRGYYESATLTGYDNRLLCHLGGAWNLPPRLEEGWVARLAESPGFGPDTARSIFRSVFSTDGWVWKDPRLCVLVPYWASLVDIDGYLMVWRDPREVVASTRIQAGMTLEQGLAHWEQTTRAALVSLNGQRVAVCSYSCLLEDRPHWFDTVGRLLGSIGRSPIRGIDVLDQVVDRHLHRQQASDRLAINVDQRCESLVARLTRLEGFHESMTPVALSGSHK
jgi:hypothetical protein